MEHVCTNWECAHIQKHTQRYTKQSTSWGIAALAMHGDKSHYYLCTLIKGEGKLFINHTCPRGRETGGREGVGKEGAKEPGMWVTGELPGLIFLRPATQISNRLVHHSRSANTSVVVWSCSASVHKPRWHTHTLVCFLANMHRKGVLPWHPEKS